MVKLSFVIPCYNCSESISSVVEKIYSNLKDRKEYAYEVILVNDGSVDNTIEILKNISEKFGFVISVDLSKNFGQHSALMAGYSLVTGDYVIGLDDDGEHDPDDMFKLIDELEKGYDYVCADFISRQQSFIKGLGSKFNNWMATTILNKPASARFSSYYIMKRYLVDEIAKCKNPFPYVGGMIVSITKKLSCVPIVSHNRQYGSSNYSLKKSLSLLLNGFTAFSVKPLRVASALGMIMACCGFMYGFYIIIRKICVPETLVGYSSLMAVILFVGGMLMMTLGLLGEYVGRIYISINKVPQYVIKEIYAMPLKNEMHVSREDMSDDEGVIDDI